MKKLIDRFKFEKVNKIFYKNNHYRSNTILGNMPDWNPVEIIGKYPSQLSFLYINI